MHIFYLSFISYLGAKTRLKVQMMELKKILI